MHLVSTGTCDATLFFNLQLFGMALTNGNTSGKWGGRYSYLCVSRDAIRDGHQVELGVQPKVLHFETFKG